MDVLYLLIFAFVILLLGIVIIAFAFFYSNLAARFNQLQKQNLYLRFHVQEKSLQKVNSAKDKSLKIIAEAVSQAQDLLKKAEIFKNETSEQTQHEVSELIAQQKQALLSASDQLLNGFKDAIKNLHEEDINIFKNITKDIENVATDEIKEFEKKLHDETIGQRNLVDQKIKEEFAKMMEEVERYKKDKLAEIDRQIYTLVQEVTKEVIGKRLSFEDHKELIMAALERAKSEIASGNNT